MKVKIHFEWNTGHRDELIIEGDSSIEMQKKAQVEVDKRKPDNYWSETAREDS